METARLWALRILFGAFPVFLSMLADSSLPMWAFALAWVPNGFFLSAFLRGALRLPRFLEPVHPVEPTIYRWAGAGLIKRIVETRTWPRMGGFEPPPKAKNRQELLDRTEESARGAEVCHAATFALASLVAVVCFAVGKAAAGFWIGAFNLLLNGYPVMLQRTHRRRIQEIRMQSRPVRYPAPAQASSAGPLGQTCEKQAGKLGRR
jgi:hypothetical protein